MKPQWGLELRKGFYGDVSLDGLTAAGMMAKCFGPIHEGNGERQIIIDEKSASPEQRTALEKILTSDDTEPMATISGLSTQ